jgi:hypothetical protein
VSIIDAWAFFGCSLDSIWFPPLLDTIDERAFQGCTISRVQIPEGNRHFRVRGDFLLSFDRRVLIQYFGDDSTVEIPREIEEISKFAFSGQSDLQCVRFESDSKLRRIKSRSFFSSLSLRSICLPSFVERIDGAALICVRISEVQIAEGNRHFRVSGNFLLTFDGKSLIWYFGRDSLLQIPLEIEVICKTALAYHRELSDLTFSSWSRLRRIGDFAFTQCDLLRSIRIPQFVDTISATAFCSSEIREVLIAEGNTHFRVSGDFLLKTDGNSLVRYLGNKTEVTVLREIEGFCSRSFQDSAIRILLFANNSLLRRIDSKVFFRSWSLCSM